MIAAGRRVTDVAAELGVNRSTVSKWQQEARLRERVETDAADAEKHRAAAAARARAMAKEATPAMMRVAIGIATGKIKAEPPALRARLEAAKTVLDRGGVPTKAEIDATHRSDAADALAAAIDMALNGGDAKEPAA